jgi:beta-lactamase superfamily II metal-dependent hydrolase
MYRQGIGDCFLLTFYGGGEPRHILIDCGVLSGTPGGKDKIRRVAKHIKEETNNQLKALVATHEHWDHVSGFYDAKDIFDRMDIKEIWLAWTENPSDAVARDLKTRNHLRLQAVHMALAQMANSPDPQLQAYGQGVAALLGFFGGSAGAPTLAAFSEKTSEAMDAVIKRSPSPTYFKPGEIIRRDWLPGVRLYVLGPPLEKAMLKKMEGRVGTETYELTGAGGTFALALEEALATEDRPTDPGRAERLAAALPFHPSLQWRDEGQLVDHPKFGSLFRAYKAGKLSWRRIDQDWLLSAARLGLQLDSATNNTSLVLAFEFSDTGEVLLFAADAQIGSWKSWLTLKEFATADLLRRTVFYKVGHHGSHNATLKEGGLEAMTSPKLVAAIPVDQNFANNTKHWEMPSAELYKRLQELTRGRILRADAAWPTSAHQPPQVLSAPEWQRFTGAVRLDPGGLFIDYFI